MKICSKCRIEKPLDSFWNDTRRKSGKRPLCRECEKVRSSAYHKTRYATDAEFRTRSIDRANRQQQEKPHLHRENSRRWYDRDLERGRAKSRRGQQNYRKRKRGGEGTYTSEEWLALCLEHHNRCAACGEEKPLSADHVVPLSKGGSNYISNIQPLCVSCNSKKHDKTIDYRRNTQ